jgi:integrase/recombinase XerC
LPGELDAVNGVLASGERLSAESVPRVRGLVERFGIFAVHVFGVSSLAEVAPAHVDAFVHCATSEGPPSVATMRLRRSALRLAFRVARELGFLDGDPTVDLALPSRTDRAARPLTDLEVQRGRRAALEDLDSTRLSVPWALGEATARTAEIPHVRARDVDLDGRRVWLVGSSSTTARWGQLTAWGMAQLDRHLQATRPSPSEALTARTSSVEESRRAHASEAIREVLRRAGLLTDPMVRPASLPAWAGRQVLDETGRIDVVARALGMRSLDGAARAIGWDWSSASGVTDA